MSHIVKFNDTDDDVLEVNLSADTAQYIDKPHIVINPDLQQVELIERKYWKLVGGAVVPMTLAERAAKDAVIQAKKDALEKPLKDLIAAAVKIRDTAFTSADIKDFVDKLLKSGVLK